MIKSMTGYGKASGMVMDKSVVVEIKSLNHRYSEVFCRLPMELAFCEQEIRKALAAKVARGKVEVNIKVEHAPIKATPVLNEALAKEYYALLVRLRDMLGITEEVKLANVISFRSIFEQAEETQDEAMLPEIMAIIDEATASLVAMKIIEGENLGKDLWARVGAMKEVAGEIEKRLPLFLQEYGQKLGKRVKEIAAGINVDEARLVQEIAFIAEKSDITEEITRFNSHITQLEGMLKNEEQEAVGRKMDFLLQEMGREVNTIGSKSNDVEIARAVITLKSELSKVREQVQNIE